MQEVKLHEKKAIPKIAYNRARGNLGLSEYSKLKQKRSQFGADSALAVLAHLGTLGRTRTP